MLRASLTRAGVSKKCTWTIWIDKEKTLGKTCCQMGMAWFSTESLRQRERLLVLSTRYIAWYALHDWIRPITMYFANLESSIRYAKHTPSQTINMNDSTIWSTHTYHLHHGHTIQPRSQYPTSLQIHILRSSTLIRVEDLIHNTSSTVSNTWDKHWCVLQIVSLLPLFNSWLTILILIPQAILRTCISTKPVSRTKMTR